MVARTPCVLCLGLFLCPGPLRALAADVPSISFAYSQLLDDDCANLVKEPLDSQVVAEARRVLPQLEAAWRREGPRWLRATKDAVGQPFSFREAKAALVTCGLSSMSHPLIINMRRHVRADEPDQPRATRQFVGAVFHELLHRYVSDIVTARGTASTPLLRKYEKESAIVRNHLHLFAIREAVHVRRGRSRELQEVEAFEADSPRAQHFARAREIVRSEGFERFLEELRSRA